MNYFHRNFGAGIDKLDDVLGISGQEGRKNCEKWFSGVCHQQLGGCCAIFSGENWGRRNNFLGGRIVTAVMDILY